MENVSQRKRRLVSWLMVLLISIVLRVALLDVLPGNGALNQDEAFAGYEAWSLLNYGIDAEGYSFPVYFVAWGSGMNVLESYLMMPLIRLMDLTNIAIRLPSAVLGIITVIFFYLFARKDKNDEDGKFSFLCFLFMAIVPWNVMSSRWALESNLLPVFLLLGCFFIIKGIDNSKFFIPAAIFYGMALYAYSAAWIVMPFLIVAELLYLLIFEKIKIDKYLVLSLLILVILALPLMLFVLINCGYINSITFIGMTIPKMPYFRGNEVNLDNILHNLSEFKDIVLLQSDGIAHNSTSVGIYYKISTPFFIVGIIVTIIGIIKGEKNITRILVLMQFLCACILGALIDCNVNRINIVHIPVIYFICIGLYHTLCFFYRRKYYQILTFVILAAYVILFVFFVQDYICNYNNTFAENFGEGLRECVDFAKENVEDGSIYVMDASYANILVYMKYPTDEYVEEVEWEDENAAFRNIIEVGEIKFTDFTNEKSYSSDIYICRKSNESALNYMVEKGLEIKQFGYYVVGYRE
ncbi:Dolichyl-phosphate-mannose-protein mannosyltransferase [Butyrivibrio proteoclasticus]|uniref:Dolichyl-phosphate-mannose-protein mannosyltransferase n=1 Tax=Butyrivibrio proteoclasticus TaxID=43305 RepID=A0A1I5PQA0_9FIRM|nr:glycosyltransferase family 39 protein [Butyrivibrio proteoclasticus]SFP36077.1 Dolichyl-phosphate-mannose-protein mannosyltransferase [Butyrivibrio proteoclasticus]